ncbi:MAG: DUF333 domain-containing protein [archaeon]|nr:MAG: DUF333 domain-containing protein [archaeon]
MRGDSIVEKSVKIVLVLFLFLATTNTVLAISNPAAVYCEKMGYEWITEEIGESQVGICKFSETESCYGTIFFQGKCGQEHSYCVKNGYELKITENPGCIFPSENGECVVCVLDDGTEKPLTEFLDLVEGGVISPECGDGLCEFGEAYLNCPQDCPSGSPDTYCDKIEDVICDPDCGPEEDIDCKPRETTTTVKERGEEEPMGLEIIISVIALIAIVLFLMAFNRLRKKKINSSL